MKKHEKSGRKVICFPPSLSQYLSKLEQELETPLFSRTKGELLPTRAGKKYIECAQKMLVIKDELYQEIARLSKSGHINVATSSVWSLRMVSELISRINKEFSGVSMELFEGNLKPIENLLRENNVDIAFVGINSVEKFKNCSEILGQEEILFAIPAGHPFFKNEPDKKELTAAELSAAFGNEKFILPRKDSTVVFLSLSPKIFLLSAVIYRNDRPLTLPENRFIEMAREYYKSRLA